jgi:cleavage stimulation factor subunit 2
VANIAYDVTEQQIISVLEQVGPVDKFRLIFDKDTGKPKGFGFCTYYGKHLYRGQEVDHETAASAVRNLNNYEVNGRTIKIDFADHDKDDMTRDDDVKVQRKLMLRDMVEKRENSHHPHLHPR